jgi:phosphatidylethanolamine-binding protein (PEBP) family uncharacterized protein
MVLLVEDGTYTHWTTYGLSAAGGSGLAPDGRFPAGAKEGENSAGEQGWTPPCPPEGDDAHTYMFALYALPKATGLEAGASPAEVRAAVEGALGRGTFTGTYKR